VRTAYVPESGAAPDGQLTHVHLGQRDPPAAEDADLLQGGRAGVETSQPAQPDGEESWNRELSTGPSEDAATSALPEPRLRSGDWERQMKGQRHDDSVLFSLGHLRRLAVPDATRKPTGSRTGSRTGSTGLLEIRPLGVPVASALLLPSEPEEKKGGGVGLIVGVAALGVLLGAGALLGILYLVQPKLLSAVLAGDELEVLPEGKRSTTKTSPARARPTAAPRIAASAKPAPPRRRRASPGRTWPRRPRTPRPRERPPPGRGGAGRRSGSAGAAPAAPAQAQAEARGDRGGRPGLWQVRLGSGPGG